MPKVNNLRSVLEELSALSGGAELVKQLLYTAGQAAELMQAETVLQQPISQGKLSGLLSSFDEVRASAVAKLPALATVLNPHSRMAIVELIGLKIPL